MAAQVAWLRQGIGVVTLTRVKHRREILFASLPTLFAIHQFIEGFVSSSDLPESQYRFDPTERTLVSRNQKKRYRIGDRLPVQVARIDKLHRRAYFVPFLAGTKGSR